MADLLQGKSDKDAVQKVMEDLLRDVAKLAVFDPPEASSFSTQITPYQIQGTPYSICEKLGGGDNAYVYVGRKAGSDELLAIKLEKKDKKRGAGGLTLLSEYYNYRMLGNLPECKRQGFCSDVRQAHNDEYKVLIMELLGSSLEELMTQCGGKLSLPTVLRLAEQMLHRLETLHSTHKVHGNVKPENFVMGRVGEQVDVVYCIDLQDCVTYWRNGEHVPYEHGVTVSGNPIFMCINGHENVRKSRRSDIESLAYTLIYLLQGSLPWCDLSKWPKRRHSDRRIDMKDSYGRRTLSRSKSAAVRTSQPPAIPESADSTQSQKADKEASGSDEEVPGEFFDLLVRVHSSSLMTFLFPHSSLTPPPHLRSCTQEYAKTLVYSAEPNYEQLRASFRSLAERKGIAADAKWDWEGICQDRGLGCT